MIKVGQLYREGMANTIRDNVRNRVAAFVVNYKGLKASQITSFRKTLQSKKAELFVTRNTIAGVALKDLDVESIGKDLEGQTAFVWSDTDVVEISKTLVDFSKANESFVVRGGILDGVILSQNDVKRLSDLPSREVLLAQLLGTIQAPLTQLVSVLNANSRNLVSILKQYSDQKGGN